MKVPATVLLVVAFQLLNVSAFAQGSLTPPGAPAPTMKSLDQIEPRTLISSLPFTIASSGSYRVTGNLIGAAGQDGIVVNADNVTVDLGGFELVGAGTGTAMGVHLVAGHTNVTIRNGTLRGWPGNGIGVDGVNCTDTRVEQVRALNNGNNGIVLATHAMVNDCLVRGNTNYGLNTGGDAQIAGVTAVANGLTGIIAGSNCVVRNCVARSNTSGRGISVGSNCAVSNCASMGNGTDGFTGFSGTTFQNCSAQSNTGYGFYGTDGVVVTGCALMFNTAGGIDVGNGATITRCSVEANGNIGIFAGIGALIEECAVHQSGSDGIRASGNCLILANKCDDNGNTADGAGIHTTAGGNRIEGNAVTNNDRGIDVDAAGNFVARNTARANTTNWSVAAGNVIVVVAGATNGVAVSGNSGGTAPDASKDPNANFSY